MARLVGQLVHAQREVHVVLGRLLQRDRERVLAHAVHHAGRQRRLAAAAARSATRSCGASRCGGSGAAIEPPPCLRAGRKRSLVFSLGTSVSLKINTSILQH